MKRPQQPAFDPGANPVKLRCAGNEVFGWLYPDGTLEVVCRATRCKRRGIARHLFFADTDQVIDLPTSVVEQHTQRIEAGRNPGRTPHHQPPRSGEETTDHGHLRANYPGRAAR